MTKTATARKIEQEPYGTSTVAMSIYNLLATTRRAMTLQEIATDLQRLQHPEIDEKIFKRAASELIKRRLVKQVNDFLTCADPHGRIVRMRNRRDVKVNRRTGEVQGGWSGWMISDPAKVIRPIEEVLQ